VVKRVSPKQIAAARSVELIELLELMSKENFLSFNFDQTFKPVRDLSTERVLVVLKSGLSVELLITGQKWFDTRKQSGGGGAIDLYMYLVTESFTQAVLKLAVLIDEA
jgi:hypothetical protein